MVLDKFVVYDVEIATEVDKVEGGWENPEGMGFASAVAYDYGKDQYFFFLHENGRQGLIDLLRTRTAVTFNGIKFDSRVVLGNDRIVELSGETVMKQAHCHRWNNIDLLLEYIRARFNYPNVSEAEKRLGDKTIHDGSFSLDGIAEGIFGLHKTGHGANAPILYQNKKYEELFSYNLHDVRLTKKIFNFILKYGFIVDRTDRIVRMPPSSVWI
jgi:hypothetical protein